MRHYVRVRNRDSARKTRYVLAIIVMSYAMIVVDISIAITALPNIQRQFNLSIAHLSWVQNAYTLVFGGFLLLGARLGDVYGRRRTFIYGLLLFAIASFLIGCSRSGDALIAFRAIQGLGAALLAPSTLSLLSTSFPAGHERTKAFGAYAAVAGAAATVGLVLGGLFAGYLNWRVGFFINPPIAVVLVILSRRFIDESDRTKGNFDFGGALLSTIGMSLIVYSLVESTGAGNAIGSAIWLLPAGLAVLGLFIWHEARTPQPILPLKVFKSAERSSAIAGRLLFLAAMAPFWFFTSQFLQLVLGFSPEAAGMAFLPTTIVNFLTAKLAPKFMLKIGSLQTLLIGLVSCTAGMYWLSQLSVQSNYIIAIAPPMLLIGGGQGFVLAPLTTMGVAKVNPEDSGAASGAVNVAHQLGGSLGLAIEIFIASILVKSSSAEIDKGVLASRIADVFTIGSILLLLAIAVIYLPNRFEKVDQLSSA